MPFCFFSFHLFAAIAEIHSNKIRIRYHFILRELWRLCMPLKSEQCETQNYKLLKISFNNSSPFFCSNHIWNRCWLHKSEINLSIPINFVCILYKFVIIFVFYKFLTATSSLTTETKPSPGATTRNFTQVQTSTLPRMPSLTSAAVISSMIESPTMTQNASGVISTSSAAGQTVTANLVSRTG